MSNQVAINNKETMQAFIPKGLDETLRYADLLSKTNFIPKDYQNKPNEIFAAIQHGADVGFSPMQALQSIAVINYRPAIWGDGLLALVRSSGLCEYCNESLEEIDGNLTAICEVKRKGEEKPTVRKFSKQDAMTAGLWGNNVWKKYPQRMLQMRARSWALRDLFPDVLKGMQCMEEVQDIKDVTPMVNENLASVDDLNKEFLQHDEDGVIDVKAESQPEPKNDLLNSANSAIKHFENGGKIQESTIDRCQGLINQLLQSGQHSETLQKLDSLMTDYRVALVIPTGGNTHINQVYPTQITSEQLIQNFSATGDVDFFKSKNDFTTLEKLVEVSKKLKPSNGIIIEQRLNGELA